MSSSSEDSNPAKSSGSFSGNRMGIPLAEFVEDVEKFVAGREVDTVLRSLDERLQQYKLLETRLLAQRKDLESKLPDIKKCLEIVKALQAKHGTQEETVVDFELAEGIYTQAEISDSDSVCLWLGANVMLEYSFDEAISLLQRNLENATSSLNALITDTQFLRDQCNITEVTIARVFNWDVQQRRNKRHGASASVSANA